MVGFDLNSEVGGACGEIVALKGRYWSTLLKNPLVAAQNFEFVPPPLLSLYVCLRKKADVFFWGCGEKKV